MCRLHLRRSSGGNACRRERARARVGGGAREHKSQKFNNTLIFHMAGDELGSCNEYFASLAVDTICMSGGREIIPR